MTRAIQIRIDEKLKKESDKILKDLGLDAPNAIRLFLRQVVVTQSIPFRIRRSITENGFTEEFENEVLRAAREDEIIGPFKTAKEMIRSLNGNSKRTKNDSSV